MLAEVRGAPSSSLLLSRRRMSRSASAARSSDTSWSRALHTAQNTCHKAGSLKLLS